MRINLHPTAGNPVASSIAAPWLTNPCMFNTRPRVLSVALIVFIASAVSAQTRIAQISDIHLGNVAAPTARARLVAIVESINEKPPDAVIVTGDIGEDPIERADARQVLSAITVPVHYIPGNHDTTGADIAAYRAVFGPDYYKLELNNLTIFALDSQLIGNFSDPRSDVPLPMDPIAQAEGEIMLQWLSQQTVSPAAPIAIVMQHVPVVLSPALPRTRPYWVISEPFRSRELQEFERLGVRHVLAGHWHIRDRFDFPQGTITQHVAPSVAMPLFGSLPGYSLHTISATAGVQTEYVMPTSDVALKMTSPRAVGSGDKVTYAIDVTNKGPKDASGVVLTATLPGGQTLVSASATQGSCTGSNPLICNIGIVPVAAHVSVDVVIQTHSPGTITNSVALSANQYDSDESNNQVTANTAVENRDFLLQVSPSSAVVKAGGSASYTVTAIPSAAGFHENIVLSCSGLLPPATCSFAPAQFVPGTQQVNSVLTVSGAMPAMMASGTAPTSWWPLSAAALAFAVALGRGDGKRRARRLLAGAIFLLVLGCGGGSDNARRELPPTTMTITITGSAASVQRSTTTTLIVQP